MKKLCLLIILCIGRYAAYSQSSCPNINFEKGDLSGWTGTTGNCCPSCAVNATTPGIVSGRHTIMSGTGTDPLACNDITVVYPDGGLYSVRLGNSGTGGQGECLQYQFTVDSNNALFIYRYAVVLQDPGHPACQQPRFNLTIKDQSNNTIPCGFYSVSAASGLTGFKACGGVIYRKWTTVGVDLTSYIGKTLSMQFCTGDCSLGGHYGYAYIDGYCSALQIITQYCMGDTLAALTAPTGFTYLWNTGETTQKITITSPVQGTKYTCTLTSVTGCTVTVSTVLKLFDPVAKFISAGVCNNIQFTDSSSTPSGSVLSKWLWDFGDGSAAVSQTNPLHTYNNNVSGQYNVKLSITNDIGCTDAVTQPVSIIERLKLTIDSLKNVSCYAGKDGFVNILTKSGTPSPYSYMWSNADTTEDVDGLTAGNYSVIATDKNQCKDSIKIVITQPQVLALNTVSANLKCNAEKSGNIDLTVTGGTIPYQYTWSNAAVTEDINKLSAGNYLAKVKDAHNCEDSILTVITEPQVLSSTITKTENICFGICDATATRGIATGGTTPYIYEWSTSDTSATIQNLCPGTYTLLLTDSNNCQFKKSVIIESVEKPSVILTTDKDSINSATGMSTTISTTTNIKAVSYLWTPSKGLSCTTCINPVATPKKTTVYTLTITDVNGCITSDSIEVIVFERQLFVPNVFTPNGDGWNNVFDVVAIGYKAFHIVVYNRWGSRMFETTDANEKWNGRIMQTNGNAPDGVYYYVVEVKEFNDAVIRKNGFVTLIR